jgi:hypothetical protein
MKSRRFGSLTAILSLLAVISVSVFLLINCGGGGSTSIGGTQASTIISGQAVDGPIAGAQVSVYALNPDGSTGSLLGSTTTDGNGNYSVNIGSYSGNILAVVAGGTYTDASTGKTVNNALLRGALTGVTAGGSAKLVVTPMTELAVQYAGSTLSTTAINNGNSSAAILMYGIDIINTTPADVTNAVSVGEASADSKNYGLYLAAISTMMNQNGIANAASAVSLIVGSIQQNSGKLGSGMATAMQGAMTTFASNVTQNQSGVTPTSITSNPIYCGIMMLSAVPVTTVMAAGGPMMYPIGIGNGITYPIGIGNGTTGFSNCTIGGGGFFNGSSGTGVGGSGTVTPVSTPAVMAASHNAR